MWRAGQAPVARGASAPGADRLGAARPRAARRALHDGVQVRRQQRQHLCIRVAAGHLQPRPGMSACGGQAPAGLPPQAPSAPPAPHSAPRTSSGHCSAAGSARAAAGAARSGLASAAACCCAACSALEHSVVRARTLAVKWHSAAVKEGRSRGACSQSTDMVLKPCPPRRVSLLKRLFSWAQSKHWLIALQPYPAIRSRCRQLASRARLSACCLAPNSSSAWLRHEAHSKRRRRKAAHGAQRKVPADGGARPGSGLQRPAGTRPLCVSCLWCTPSAACQRWTDLCRWTPLHWLARWPSGRRGRRGLRSGTGARPAHPKRTASVMPTLLVSAAACSCLMAKKPAWGAAQ